MSKLIFLTAFLLSLVTNCMLGYAVLQGQQEEPAPVEEILPADTPDWDTFILALAWVESRWDSTAVGPTNDLGYLQITPVMVNDANRISGYEKYSLDDRLSIDKSIEMFNLVQNTYNPDHDLQFALKLQNPYSKVSYHRAVMKKYQELRSL